MLLGSAGAKAARRTLMKSTPEMFIALAPDTFSGFAPFLLH